MADRHFLVVGGTQRTGLELVKHLLGLKNVQVSVLGRKPNPDFKSPRLAQFAVDVTNREALLPCLDAVARRGKLSCAVFLQRRRPLDDFDKDLAPDEFDEELAVAVGATKNVIEYLVERRFFATKDRSKSIVLVGSIADSYVAPEQPPGYLVAKAGLSQLARYYALTLGPLGIRVNSVSPCVVDKGESRDKKKKWAVDRFKEFIPLGRMGKPQDIVNSIMFLAGEQASYITGQNIVVDGGLTLRSHESLLRDIPHGK